jgi:hypothetical protein
VDSKNEELIIKIGDLEQEFRLMKQENKTLLERLDRSDREKRMQSAFIVFLILSGFFSVLAGLKYITRSTKLIQAERFTLVDKDGTRRAELFMTEQGDPELTFLDKNQKHRLFLYSADHDNSAGINIYDDSGKSRLRIRGTTDNTAGLIVYDTTGRRRTDLCVGKDGWAGLGVYDQLGRTRIDNSLRPNDSAGLTVYSPEGEPLVKLHNP